MTGNEYLASNGDFSGDITYYGANHYANQHGDILFGGTTTAPALINEPLGRTTWSVTAITSSGSYTYDADMNTWGVENNVSLTHKATWNNGAAATTLSAYSYTPYKVVVNSSTGQVAIYLTADPAM